MRRVLALVAVVALLTGCSVPGRPAWWSDPQATPTATSQVERPWQPGDPQLGIDVYWERTVSDPVDHVRGKARRVLDYVVDLGANSVSFSFPLFTDGITSTSVYSADRTPTPEQVSLVVDEAVAQGLRVTLRPILNEEILLAQHPDAWRGSIAPTDPERWLVNYTAAILPFASVSAGVSTFVVGTELNSMEDEPGWPEVVAAVRSTYPGELSYSMNSDSFLHSPGRAPVRPAMLDAYPPMPVDDDATVAELVDGWRAWLSQVDTRLLPELILSEVGIAAQDGAYRHPVTWGSLDVPLNLQVQRNWYEAVCETTVEHGLAGVYWWHLNFDVDPAAANPAPDDRMAFTGRPAEQSIRDCFARLS